MSRREYPGFQLGTEYADGSPPNNFFTPSQGWSEITAGETGHYGFPNFPPDRAVGGSFFVRGERNVYGTVGIGELWRGGALNQRYVGNMCAAILANPQAVSTADGSARSAEAFAKMRPTTPQMRLLTSIYELKDLPGMLQQRFHKNGLKNIGSYFLAYKFGWAPLLGDIRDLILKQKDIENRINFLLRRNGKPTRQSITLSDTKTVNSLVGGFLYTAIQPSLVTQYYVNQPQYQLLQVSGERWWAVARFRIHLPEGAGSISYRRALMAELYGLYPSPSSIYKMVPWTWLIDWFSNAGYVLQNLEATMDDRVAADYGYMMRMNWSRSETQVVAKMHGRDGAVIPVTSTSYREWFTKTRIGIDPFGLTSGNPNLSGMQLAILGALGLSRLR